MSLRGCSGGGGQTGRPATENHQVILTAIAVDPILRVALTERLLVVSARDSAADN
jgi:hypothetical protein